MACVRVYNRRDKQWACMGDEAVGGVVPTNYQAVQRNATQSWQVWLACNLSLLLQGKLARPLPSAAILAALLAAYWASAASPSSLRLTRTRRVAPQE